MGAGIPLIVILLIGLVIAAVAIMVVSRSVATRQHEVTHAASDAASASLDYEVPAGQDPSVVIAALDRQGYTAVADERDPRLVHVACPAGVDRERARVRAAIGDVHTTAIDSGAAVDPGQVRFRDER